MRFSAQMTLCVIVKHLYFGLFYTILFQSLIVHSNTNLQILTFLYSGLWNNNSSKELSQTVIVNILHANRGL